MYELAATLQDIRQRVSLAESRSGRKPGSVQIMAVTKTHSFDAVQAALDSGLVLIGENRVQEAQEKIPAPQERGRYGVHLIGHLQKNKAKKAAAFFDAVQSLDDPETLEILDRTCISLGRTLDVLIEMNTSQEEAKHGCESPDQVRRLVEKALSLPGLRLRGLMTVGPLGNHEAANRRAFSSLRCLYEDLGQEFSPPLWDTLSMGMSQDFVTAVEEGSTLVRLGTVLFGGRP